MIDLKAANHTNRELELMLAGTKPLAMFYALTSELPDEELIPERLFSSVVEEGSIVRKDAVVSDSHIREGNQYARLKYVFFALNNEDWRIEAMLLLKEQHAKTNLWNETCERIESALLGYTDDEIDAWCEKSFPKQAL